MSVGLAAVLQAAVLAAIVAATAGPLGNHLARTFTTDRDLAPERWIYRLGGIDPRADQRWTSYLISLLAFSLASILAVIAFLQLQAHLPLSNGMGAMPFHQALNTAISFTTNTNWQSYSGEAAVGHFAQMAALAVQNFASAAVGIAVVAALIRGFTRERTDRLGSFWVDLVRGVVRVLLPGAAIAAIVLVLGGVVQNLDAPHEITTLTGGHQQLLGGPVASQEAIKELGTNGGGFFNANSAHPLENPSPFTNLFENALMLVIPFGLVSAFGVMVGNRRQARTVSLVMATILGLMVLGTTVSELAHPGTASQLAGAAMEGKETRLGVPASTLFAASTTGTSTGAVNAAHDSLSALAGGALILNMGLGEVAPGGTGSGLYGMLILAMVAVFIAGLMVGRTPEYLGKRLGPGELKLIAGYILVTPALVLLGTGVALAFDGPTSSILNSGPHGLSEVLYAFTSAANNNGSAFGGLTSATTFYDLALALAMLLGRFLPIVLVLALAASIGRQGRVPVTAGTLPTDTRLFAGLLLGVVLVIAGLTYLPALALGPLAEGVR
ncbi:MAG: potassium-transporting ATPase subunit KdpA [Solirubrobacteraceae bacterium]|nr:potassium-transporting ATPase subunit KdpA [Solirubrobacteraceae bacterium]